MSFVSHDSSSASCQIIMTLCSLCLMSSRPAPLLCPSSSLRISSLGRTSVHLGYTNSTRTSVHLGYTNSTLPGSPAASCCSTKFWVLSPPFHYNKGNLSLLSCSVPLLGPLGSPASVVPSSSPPSVVSLLVVFLGCPSSLPSCLLCWDDNQIAVWLHLMETSGHSTPSPQELVSICLYPAHCSLLFLPAPPGPSFVLCFHPDVEDGQSHYLQCFFLLPLFLSLSCLS